MLDVFDKLSKRDVDVFYIILVFYLQVLFGAG